uniref:General transcription factor IIE subunit 1-like n=1 Tax=Ciona intestinalis TaxID=7719 RepID=F6RRS1_CIOIN
MLKFDKKQLRVVLNKLKNDKFLKSRSYVETQEDGKVTKQNYYYINYRTVANVIKYKLHHMHKRIETRERDSNNRPSFKCPTCGNTYSDLEVNQLIDPMFGTLNCVYCKTEVLEDKESASNQDARTSQARFNQQMEPLYKMLKEVENITLSQDILEPKPTLIPQLHPKYGMTRSAPKARASKPRSGEDWSSTRSDLNIDYKQEVIIDMGGGGKVEEEKKEMPRWLTESTVTGDSIQSYSNNGNEAPRLDDTDSKSTNNEVLQTLIVQERSKVTAAPSYHDNHDDASESDEFDDVTDDAVVMVAGKQYSYHEVANQGGALVELMTEAEKDEYIRIGQQVYEAMED